MLNIGVIDTKYHYEETSILYNVKRTQRKT